MCVSSLFAISYLFNKCFFLSDWTLNNIEMEKMDIDDDSVVDLSVR